MTTPEVHTTTEPFVPLSKVAELLGCSIEKVQEILNRQDAGASQEFYSIAELARRWRCSRGTVYNRLRAVGAQVLDFAKPGKRGKKAVRASTILQIENRQTKRLM